MGTFKTELSMYIDILIYISFANWINYFAGAGKTERVRRVIPIRLGVNPD